MQSLKQTGYQEGALLEEVLHLCSVLCGRSGWCLWPGLDSRACRTILGVTAPEVCHCQLSIWSLRGPGSQVGGPCSQGVGHVGLRHPGLCPRVWGGGVCGMAPSTVGYGDANAPQGETGSKIGREKWAGAGAPP